ncbi:MAG TPA: hypothetical protein VKX49_23555 [Bryobacteraceae bacterium]|nr:hypothetical protein [Bryobacteraceae bacterium]
MNLRDGAGFTISELGGADGTDLARNAVETGGDPRFSGGHFILPL